MRIGIALTLTTLLALGGSMSATSAAMASSGSTVRFATSQQTPQGPKTSSGTLTIITTRTGAITLTITPDGGQPPETTALVVGAQGSFALDPTVRPPANGAAVNRAVQFMTELILANYVGTGATSSQSAASFVTPPVTIVPTGSGTAVQTQIALARAGDQYVGSSEVATTTSVPAIGGTSLLPDSVHVTVGVNTANNQLGAIQGVQTDVVTLPGKSRKTVTLVSLWAFSAAIK